MCRRLALNTALALSAYLLLCLYPSNSHGFVIKEDESFLQTPVYYNQNELEDAFARLQKLYPDLAQVESIGRSLEGRELLVIRIGRHMRQRNLLTPPVKYIGNMHGDETVGRQLLVYLAQYLLYNYDKNVEVSTLVNTTDIYIMPSMNPDGFARSQEGNCESLPHYVGRTNAAGVDLNRDFPDRLENQYELSAKAQSRQPETAALVEWILKLPFVISANFHGGAVVASYPFDNSIAHHECCAESLTPDDRVFKKLAHTYADNNPLMRKGKNCNDSFKDGITNGANWYELNGGMQDFNYAFSNCFELTIELSCCKYPPASELPIEWKRNKRSMLELLKLAHMGIKGIVKDANGYPIKDASIVVAGLENKSIRTTERGEYWRLLTPGLYSVQAQAFGYQPSAPQEINVTNDNVEAQRIDFILLPVETSYDGEFRKLKVERAEPPETNHGFLTAVKFEHHNYDSMTNFLHNIAESYPSITRLYTIGKSVQNRELWVMEISKKPGEHIPTVPEFKYVANMHGNEVVGKEMLLLLTKYICELYLQDERITNLVNNTRMHFLYSMNPDGYEMAKEGDRTSFVGRTNANNKDLNRNFPDQYGTDENNRVTEPEVAAVMNWTLSLPFVLSANLHGGALVANYPYDDNEKDFSDLKARMRIANMQGRKINPTDDHELFKHLAKVYAEAHPTMHLGKPCALFKNEKFTDGITNGAEWYSVTGGMQDWNYVRAGVLELTIEMGCDKFPLASELPKFWDMNREPLLRFIEQVHVGVYGYISSSISTHIAGAAVTLDDAKHAVYSTINGEYWKLALPGRHNLTIIADGFSPERIEIEVPASGNQFIRIDIPLMRDDPQHWSSAYDFRILENVVHTHYHTNPEIREELARFDSKMGQIAAFRAGESEFGFHYDSLKLTANIGEPEEEKFKILIVSSFSNTAAPLGREMAMNLARHITEGYKIREPPILRLLHKSVIYILPLRAQFEDIINSYHQNKSICDPVLTNSLGDRLLSPEMDKARDLFLDFLKAEQFDLVLTFTAGSSELNYPKTDEIFEKLAHNINNIEFNFPPLHCPTTATRSVQLDMSNRVTQFFHKMYNIPLFSLGLSCCGMPVEGDIGSVWRRNIDKIKNFMHLIDTGVVGKVQNAKGEQLREAHVQLTGHSLVYNVSKNAAQYRIILPADTYEIEIHAAGYEAQIQRIQVSTNQLFDMGVITLDAVHVLQGLAEPAGIIQNKLVSISGFVLDESNHPISGAKVSLLKPIHKHFISNHTDEFGGFTLSNVIAGEVTLQVEARGYFDEARIMTLKSDKLSHGVMFRLKQKTDVFGFPRMVFILLASIMGILFMVLCLFCGKMMFKAQNGKMNKYYSFSLLPQKGEDLFEDDGDDGETELFKSPIKRGMAIKPYYDEVNLSQISDTDDEDVTIEFHKRTN